MWDDILLVIGAYLFGSLPQLAALGKLGGITLDGDRHLLLWERGGRVLGFTGVVLDIAKGAIPVLVGNFLDFDIVTVTAAGVAVVTGQMWSIFCRFNGEKGNSTGVGMAVTLAFKPFLIAAVVFAIGAGIRTLPPLFSKRKSLKEWTKLGGPPSISMPLAMIAGFLILPIASWGFKEPPVVTIGLAIIFVLILIRRITAGLKVDLKGGGNANQIIINRMLLDRSFR